MTALTQSGGVGFPRPYTGPIADRTYVPGARHTWSGAIGFPRPYAGAIPDRADVGAGGDVTAVSSSLSAIIVGTISEIDGFDVIIEAYGGVEGLIGEPFFTVERLDVDKIELDLNDTGLIELAWT